MFLPRAEFWKDTKHVTLAVLLLLITADVVAATVCFELGWTAYVRFSRPLRPFIVINFPEFRQVRQGFRNIRRTLPEIANVLFLFFANLTLFTLMAYKLFGRSEGRIAKANSEPYFETFLDSFWDLYVLVTTANSPDIMLPSYDKSPFYAIFFIVYLTVNLYIFMSVFLAVVYNQFKANLKSEVRDNMARKRLLLDRAFQLLSARQTDAMPKESLYQVLDAVRPGCADSYKQVVALVLDPAGTGFVTKEAFRDVVELLHIKYVDIYLEKTLLEAHFPELYNSRASRLLRASVRHKHFR